MSVTKSMSAPVILCVDDEPSILKSLQRLLINTGATILVAENGQKALTLLQENHVNLIITDMRMPGMTGAEFLAQAASLQPDAYRILITGYADLASTISAVNVGRIHRYVQKPWDNQDLLNTIDEGLEYYRLIRQNKLLMKQVSIQNKQLRSLNEGLENLVQQRTEKLKIAVNQFKELARERLKQEKATQQVLYNIINSHPSLSGELARKVSSTCAQLAKYLSLDANAGEKVALAGLFFEIGKISMPTHMLELPLSKQDGVDRRYFLEHPQQAEEILGPAQHLQEVSQIIACQLEKYNGSGEPGHKAGNEIPLGARILAVARDFWLYCRGQITQKKFTQREAYEQIRMQQGTSYDPAVVKALSNLLHSSTFTDISHVKEGIEVMKLEEGMRLTQNLYNDKHMMLLPKGHILTAASLENLLRYQAKYPGLMLVPAEKIAHSAQDEQ